MSSEARPSFRTYSKKKLKKIFNSNITSVRERIISDETYQNLIEKSRNLTDTAIEKTGVGTILNKTKTLITNVLPSDGNSTIPKGFFDSLFSPQTANDVYFKVAIMCLWIIAIVCVLITITTMLISVITNKKGTTAAKWIFLHIFVCELFYLIYILLSMINVGLNFQLTSFWCDIAEYWMYATIPVMYLALLILSIERIAALCKTDSSPIKLMKSTCLTQVILILIWIIAIFLISVFIYVKNHAKNSMTNLPDKFIPSRLGSSFRNIISADRCSIDGQLIPFFKILFLVLFIILIVLIVKSIVVSVVYSFFPLSFCPRKNEDEEKEKDPNEHMTLTFFIILFFNLVFSFPFYMISTANSIIDLFGESQPFPMKLKISFMLRLASIILQCFVFYTFESSSWDLLKKLLGYAMRKKPRSDRNTNKKKKPRPLPTPRDSISSDDSVEEKPHKIVPVVKKKDDTIDSPTSDEDDDDVSTKDSNNKRSKFKQSEKTESISPDENDSDDEEENVPMKGKAATDKLLPRSTSVKDNPVTEITKSKTNNTNGLSKPTVNGKVTSPPKLSTTTDQNTSNLSRIEKRRGYDRIASDASSDDIPTVSVNHINEIKPTTIEPKTKTITRSISNRSYRSHHRGHWTTRAQFSRSITTTTTPNNQNHTISETTPKKSSANGNNQTPKPKDNRFSSINANSIPV